MTSRGSPTEPRRRSLGSLTREERRSLEENELEHFSRRILRGGHPNHPSLALQRRVGDFTARRRGGRSSERREMSHVVAVRCWNFERRSAMQNSISRRSRFPRRALENGERRGRLEASVSSPGTIAGIDSGIGNSLGWPRRRRDRHDVGPRLVDRGPTAVCQRRIGVVSGVSEGTG